MTNNTTPEQELRSTQSFKEVLLECAFSEGRAIPDYVTEIDLGIFASEANELRSQTLRDPKKREFGKLVYVTNDRRLLLQNESTVGNEKTGDWWTVPRSMQTAS